MAGVMLGAKSSLPSYFTGGAETKVNPLVVSFEKELGQVLNSLRKADKTTLSWEAHQKVSNALFHLWNSYQGRLPIAFFTAQLLSTADLLYKKGLYRLASVHGYGRYLTSTGVKWNEDLVERLREESVDNITSTLRATIGDVMCQFYVTEERDPSMMLTSTRSTTLSVLQKLQQVSQVALSREPLYWLVYNALVLTYSLSRSLMSHGFSTLVLEYLLWGAVCMESSVPLMALKYLQLRVNFYVAACQCYWDMRQPHNAEIFARRALDKIHELAQLEHHSSMEATESSALVFKEATLKIDVLVFKRSVLESRKKTKSVFRPKVRPTIRDLLQIPSPRSPTEKLLLDLFDGHSAQFLVVLECLSDSSKRPLDKATPSPVTELDNDTVTDVYQELFTIGTELCLRALEEAQRALIRAATLEGSNPSHHHLQQGASLTSLAVKGSGRVPMDAVVRFVRLARSNAQKEVVEILADPVIKVAKLCEDEQARRSAEALEIILAVDALRLAHKKYKVRINAAQGAQAMLSAPLGTSAHPPPPPPTAGTTTTAAGSLGQQTLTSASDEGGSAEDLFERLQNVLNLLHSACVVTDSGHTPTLVTMDFDLLLDTLVIVWEVAKPALARINSHSYSVCRQFLSHATGKQYLELMIQLVEVAHSLDLWQTDAHLHGELRLKLACLYEARAELRQERRGSKAVSTVMLEEEGLVYLYDRQRLLECVSELEGGLEYMERARAREMEERGGEKEGEEIKVLHSEYVYAITRVKVKLASTIPPPPPPEPTQKPSSLKSKVKERKERQQQREKMLSELTAPTVAVETVAHLRDAAGKNHWSTALLLMLQASTAPRPGQEEREKMMIESFSRLLQEQQRVSDLTKTTRENSHTHPHGPPSTSSPSLLPPPLLKFSTNQSMTFVPVPFADTKLQQKVAYYRLFGRTATGSNIKVRLTDKNLPGLGVTVPAHGRDTTLKVKGLQANESYVFAVAAYGESGEIVGGAIGATGPPIVACYPLSMLMLWGYCCQCAYTAGVGSIAGKASAILWNTFVTQPPIKKETDQNLHLQADEDHLHLHTLNSSLIQATPTAILRYFVQSVIIDAQLSTVQASLYSDQLCASGPLKSSQLLRLKLVCKLFSAVEVAATINDTSLCLQAIVLCLGLLSPLTQHNVPARPLLEALIYCHAVLTELPEQVVAGKDSTSTASLHHLIGSTALHVAKVLTAVQRKSLFTSFTNNARGLLLSTMQAATNVAKEIEKDKNRGGATEKEATPLPADNEQPSFLSDSHDLSIVSYATVRSALGNILPPKIGEKKKKGRKKLIATTDHLLDEAKSSEYKAFEAFLMCSQSHQGLDELDLTGQEEMVILHAVIANLPSHLAYKEVHKFRRRPQYLEFLVHLSSLTLARGGQEKVMGWIQDALHWLKKRNDLVLTPKPPQPKAGGGGVGGGAHKGRVASARGSTTALVHAKTTRRTSLTGLAPPTVTKLGAKDSKLVLPAVKEERRVSKGGPSASKALLAVGSQHTTGQQRGQQVARKPSVMAAPGGGGKKLLPATSRTLDVSLSVKITRDDIEYKAHALVATLLPELWRKHKCRKRLRAVSSEELPWRSQANIIIATCHLDVLLGRLGVGHVTTDMEPHLQRPNGLTFDKAGIIIDGVLPIHPSVIPGAGRIGNKKQQPYGKGVNNTVGGVRRLSTSLESLVINDIQLIMRHLRRSIVLASRGKHWTLLQNAARSLWNTINTLLSSASSRLEGEKREIVLGAVYGLALQPLCMAARALIELLEVFDADSGGRVVPRVPSLRFSESLDDCNAVGIAFVKQVVFLSVHTLYAHQHWEKMVEVAVRFDDVTDHSWADQLVPVIISAQFKLSNRLADHAQEMAASKKEKLQPAAHLDPGPDGYNIYGKMGHSLAITSVPLDIKTTLKRASDIRNSDEGEISLSKARSLLGRYCAAQLRQKTINDGSHGNGDIADSAEYDLADCPATPVVQVSIVVSAFDKAVTTLLNSGKKEGAAQAMSELGDLLWHCGQHKSAGRWWKEVLTTVARIQAPPSGWRKVLEAESVLSEFGVWGCLQSALNAAKLARYTCPSDLDTRLEYSLLSAALFKSLLTFSLPHPVKDMDYLSYFLPQSSTGAQLTPGLEVFSDTHRCDPMAVLTSLSWVAQELIQCHHCIKVLPVLWLYHYIAQKVCHDVTHTVLSKLFKLQAVIQLCLFDHALLLLSELLGGSGLPTTTSDHHRLTETHATHVKFNIGAPLNDAKNVKYLQLVMEKGLSSKLKQLYGKELVNRIGLARAQLYTSLATTDSHVTPPISSRSGTTKSTANRPPTNLSTVTGSPQSHASSSPGSTRPSENNSTLTKRIKSDIKLLLLDRAEKEIMSVCTNGTTPELLARCYLAMAEVAMAIHQPSLATQLSLASLRCLQSADKCADLSGHSIELDSSVKISPLNFGRSLDDMRVWLQCKSVLAKSLVGANSEWFKCDGVCGEGCEESEACGDIEMWAEFHLTAAMNALSLEPPNLDLMETHTQAGLELLHSLPEQSPHAQLLSVRLSLMLSDASCLKASDIPSEMVQVFTGLEEMLNAQMAGLSHGGAVVNTYLPHRVVLASTKLRLVHTLTLMASSASTTTTTSANHDRGALISSALTASQDGLQLLKDSAHMNPPLEAELKFYHGILCGVQSSEGSGFNFSPLLDTVKLVSTQGVDYRLSFITFCELAHLYTASSRQTKPSFKLPKTPASSDGRSVPLPRGQRSPVPPLTSDQDLQSPPTPPSRRRGSRSGLSLRPSTQEQERMSKAEREWNKERGRETYLAWCMVKSAVQSHSVSHQLRALSVELHNEDVVKGLTDKAVDDLPDFALNDLCPSETLLQVLATDEQGLPPIELMLPTAQHTDTTGLTWFKIVGYFRKLLQTCFWQKSSLEVSNSTHSPWLLHFSEQTPSTYAKCKALHSFLSQHCPSFKSCRVPPLPPFVSLSSTGQRPSVGSQSAGGQADAYLFAPDNELTVVWTKPFLSLTSTSISLNSDIKIVDEDKKEKDVSAEDIVGLFALNQKAVRTSMPPNLPSFGFESHTVRMTVKKLSQLHAVWQELTTASRSVLVESRSSSRPMSRSPSKQKRMEKPFRVPQDLIESLETAVIDLADALGSKLNKEQIPKLELQSVGAVTKVLEPFNEVSVKGEVYHFFKCLFNPVQ